MSPLDSAERDTLLRLARAAVEEAVMGNGALARGRAASDLTSALQEIRGAFVTLREELHRDESGPGRLRGCIGTLEASEPLVNCVIANARHAALDDPRFPRVAPGELPGLSIEISALTPLRPVRGHEEIVAGRDGVEIVKGPFRAVFLPQVATEQGWNVEQLLHHLACKAGIADGDWRGARFSTFQAEVFSETPAQ